MAIEQSRIEAAARAISREHLVDGGDVSDMWPENLARAALSAAFPELASDPPTHVLALAPSEGAGTVNRRGFIAGVFD